MIRSHQVNVKSVALHYDDLDTIYREVWGDHIHHGYWKNGSETPTEACLQLIEFLAEKLHLKAGTRLIDVGCGYGATARYLAKKFNCSVQGLTISAAQFNYASSLNEKKSGVELQLCDWMTNQIVAQSADVVYSIESSEHMPDFDKFFSEAARVLKSRGKIAIFAWLESDSYKVWMKKYLLQPLCDEARMQLWTRADYLNELGINGFSKVKYYEISDQVKKTWTICIRRSIWKFIVDRKFRNYLFSTQSLNREFAKTIFRIRMAFATRSMSYGLFVAEKN